LSDDKTPSDSEISEGSEERRLFFVALSRARDHLFLSRAESYNNRRAQASSLLSCLESVGTEILERVVWPDTSSAQTKPPAASHRPNEDAPPLSLTVGQLETYRRCPRQYAYRYDEGLPEGASSPYRAFTVCRSRRAGHSRTANPD
jgi:ATP-dependent exoDNAse (exonuclease V) beta subunit